MRKLITLDGDGRLVPAYDEVGLLIGRPTGEEGRSPAPRPAAYEPDGPDASHRLDEGPGRDAVRFAWERIL